MVADLPRFWAVPPRLAAGISLLEPLPGAPCPFISYTWGGLRALRMLYHLGQCLLDFRQSIVQ
jgi:hypothetical protein